MDAEFEGLESQLKGCCDHKAAVACLVNCLADRLDALTHDPVAIKAMATKLRANAADISEVICCHATPGVSKDNKDAGDQSKGGSDIVPARGVDDAPAGTSKNKYGTGAEGAMNRAAAATVSPTTGKMQAAPQGEPECPAAQTQPEVSPKHGSQKSHTKR